MATVNQIYDLVNTAASEAMGAKAITVKDTASLVSLGNQIFSTANDLDAFYSKLPDVIGRVWVKYMEVTRKDRDIQRTPLEWGIILERISINKVAKAEENTSWNKNPDPYAPEKMEDHTDFLVNMISAISTFSINKVVYENQLRTAFSSATRFAAFVELIFTDMRNGMINALNNTDRLCESTAIAQSLTHAGMVHINVLRLYNTLTNAGLTVDSARRDKDFILWAMKKVKETIVRAKELTELYNIIGADRELDEGEMVLHVLSDFASDMDVYANSDTFHKDLVELYGYKEVTSWQGIGTDASFESVSTVNIQNGEININQSGVIAHLFSRDRMGTMIDHIRTKSDYIPTEERTLYSHKADIGYFVVPDEIGIVFYMADDANDHATYE